MPDSAPSLQQIKASMRATWNAGNFGVIAKANTRSAEAFVARLALPAGANVLDVACGTGNVAIPLARMGCRVTGVDIAANLLMQARERALIEGLAIDFDEGDAEQLPYADASFDAVVTMFGAMFAPRPEHVAREFARVLKPGGLLAMANWTPASFTARMFQVGSKHAPSPAGIAPPVLWGDEAIVRERLAAHFTNIATELVPIDFDMEVNPAGAVDFFRRYFGPTQVAFSRLDSAGQTTFAADLETLWSNANVSPDPANRTLVRNEYLQVTATRV
jgi:SAM-dependent methyltransferase